MEKPSSISALINLWPTRSALAADLCKLLELTGTPSTASVHKWAQAEAIPARYHLPIVMCAQARQLPVDADLIIELHCPALSQLPKEAA